MHFTFDGVCVLSSRKTQRRVAISPTKSINNKIVRILVHRVQGPSLARSRDEGEGHRPTVLWRRLPRVGIGILDRPYDERADGDAGALGALSQPLVQRFWKLDNGSDWHGIIMPQETVCSRSSSQGVKDKPPESPLITDHCFADYFPPRAHNGSSRKCEAHMTTVQSPTRAILVPGPFSLVPVPCFSSQFLRFFP